MQNFMTTIINAVKFLVNSRIDDSKADWNESNERADSYIKNKPDVALQSDIEAFANEVDGMLDGMQDSIYAVEITANGKMNADNPVGTGSFSMNRKYGTAVGNYSHAEGNLTIASGYCSHAEGFSTTASVSSSHAEGSSTIASGNYSHAEGYFTVANSYSQHVQGEYNIPDTECSAAKRGKYAHIVGNGTSDTARSNAHTLDWDGNAWFQGAVKIGGTGQDDEAAKEVATKEYVDNAEFVSYNPQTLTDEQKAQARANIDRYVWHTFSDSYGTYTYTLAPTKNFNYELAQTVANTSNNGSISALEDIVSWLSLLARCSYTTPGASNEVIENVAKNFDAIKNSGAGMSLSFYYQHTDHNGLGASVDVGLHPGDGCVVVTIYNGYADFYAQFYYNSETNTTTEKSLNRRFADKTLSKEGYYADAKAVGDALLKIDKSEIVQADWAETDESSMAFIKNKPDYSQNGNGLTTEQINALDGMFKVCAKDATKDVNAAYSAFKEAFGITGMVEYFVAPTKSVVSEINSLSDEWISFVAIADPHGDANMQHSQGIANYLLENTNCDSILLLGDYSTQNWSETEYSNWVEPLKVNSEQVYPVIGNHEKMGNTDISVIYTDFLAEKTDILGMPESCYYYRDIEAHKLRMVFINTSETGQYTMSDEQIAWIKATAESLPDSEWHLMVCAHVDINDLDGVTRSNSPHATEIIEALSSCNGKIVGYFCGHQHIDDARDIGGIYQVLLLNDRLENINYYNGYSVTNREAGTVSEQAVSVISVNTTTCDVVVRRIGAGKSMGYNYADETSGEEAEKTLTSISVTYDGGDVAIGTAVADLTNVEVKAHYSDGTSKTVTDYTLSGTIAEGSNTITVSYGGKTATFTVIGVGEVIGGNVIGVYEGASYTVNGKTNITAHGTSKNQYTYVIVNLDAVGKKVSYNITVDDCNEVIDTQVCCSIYGCNVQNATNDTGYTTRHVRATLPTDRSGETYSGEIQLSDTEYGVIIYLYPNATFELSIKVDNAELINLTGEGIV